MAIQRNKAPCRPRSSTWATCLEMCWKRYCCWGVRWRWCSVLQHSTWQGMHVPVANSFCQRALQDNNTGLVPGGMHVASQQIRFATSHGCLLCRMLSVCTGG